MMGAAEEARKKIDRNSGKVSMRAESRERRTESEELNLRYELRGNMHL